jgi:hypothetical protein
VTSRCAVHGEHSVSPEHPVGSWIGTPVPIRIGFTFYPGLWIERPLQFFQSAHPRKSWSATRRVIGRGCGGIARGW